MKCFVCNEPTLEMVKINEYDVVCPICNMQFDLGHASHIEEELKTQGFISLSNEPLADQWSQYFLKKFPELKLIKLGISQWIYINKQGRNEVESQFLKQKEKLEKQLRDVNAILKEFS